MRARAANAGGGVGRRGAEPSLTERIEHRRAELEAAILTRIRSDGAPTEAPDPAYGEGLRAAVPLAVDYSLEAIERTEANPPPIPTALRAQARVAARAGIALEVVLRRYFAGYTLLGDFLIEEVDGAGMRRGADLQRLLRLLAASFDRLLAAVGEEYRQEASAPARGAERRRAELIERLLAGEPLEGKELDYDLNLHHVGLVAKGPEAAEAMRELAISVDRRLLLLEREDGTVWGWLGGRDRLDPAELLRRASTALPPGLRLAVGESGEGLGAWRLSHRQAKAALPIAVCGPSSLICYGEVILLAATMRDDLLASSLRKGYLEPLARERDGGRVLRNTLRAYLSARGNVSSAAAALGIRRQTVKARLRTVEALLGRDFTACTAEIELALDLDELVGEHPVS